MKVLTGKIFLGRIVEPKTGWKSMGNLAEATMLRKRQYLGHGQSGIDHILGDSHNDKGYNVHPYGEIAQPAKSLEGADAAKDHTNDHADNHTSNETEVRPS